MNLYDYQILNFNHSFRLLLTMRESTDNFEISEQLTVFTKRYFRTLEDHGLGSQIWMTCFPGALMSSQWEEVVP